MNKTTKGISFAVAMFAIAGLMVAFNNQDAYARPAPAGVGDHVMKINLIGVPNDTDRNCDSGSSSNIYTGIGTDNGDTIDSNKKHQHIIWDHGLSMTTGQPVTANKVVDHCTEFVGEDQDEAIVELLPGNYMVSIRMLGPVNDLPQNFLKICSELVSDHADEDTNHCIVDGVEVDDENLDKVQRNGGKPISTTLSKMLFDDSVEDQVWSTTTGNNFKIAQIDLWETP